MSTNKKQFGVRTSKGEVVYQEHSSDTPILPPIEYLERLEDKEPGSIKWFMEQTSIEAADRRKQLNRLITITQVGQVLGFLVAIGGLGTTIALASIGATTAASVVGGATLISLVSAFVIGQRIK